MLSVLELCSSSYARIAIDRQALLHLSSVFAPPLALASLVPGRPVKEVGVSLFHPTFVTEELTSIIARDVALSTVPVESLKIAASIEPLEAVEVLAALEAFPRELPSLTAFAFHPISGRITPTDVIFDPATTHALIQCWHSCCTTLMSVTLPAMMWVYENELGWSVVSRGNDLASEERAELGR
ncbi:hypothetical protein A0H81_11941 [Grifola frondosa]|uniref:Uncharacterized protein n=1 Tax=Grifola frondosa TaxID=5627 RepID=A0A1C7LTD1_GRIFR|nr:hypothetical protein A0H81_11941 [Grifola frondosa]